MNTCRDCGQPVLSVRMRDSRERLACDPDPDPAGVVIATPAYDDGRLTGEYLDGYVVAANMPRIVPRRYVSFRPHWQTCAGPRQRQPKERA